jgi:hypothetical protein
MSDKPRQSHKTKSNATQCHFQAFIICKSQALIKKLVCQKYMGRRTLATSTCEIVMLVALQIIILFSIFYFNLKKMKRQPNLES